MKPASAPETTMDRVRANLARRYASERRFRLYGQSAVLLALCGLVVLFVSIVGNGISAFRETAIELQVFFDPERLDPNGTADPGALASADFGGLVKETIRRTFPEAQGRAEQREAYALISSGAEFQLRAMAMGNPALVGKTMRVWVPADDDVDTYVKGSMTRDVPQSERRLSDRQLDWIDSLQEKGYVQRRFNWTFFTAGDSRQPELAGIRGAAVGSLLTLVVTLSIAFPIGVGAAIYLEEFAPKNRWTDLIEVNINNLAAVPSIVFGLLGLAVFINFFGMPRSAPLVGGLVLALMTLPIIIIAGSAALKSVPPSIREGALGIGASRMQVIFHHVLPLAMPGILTGAIIGMAHALGETAPLLMIGMVAFIVDVPQGFVDAATVLPVQIYLWADSPERAFVERTSAAILVLLAFLIAMNAVAVVLRRRFERRW